MLIAERGEFLKQATKFKGTPVPTPARYAHTLAKASWAIDAKANPAVMEATWRANPLVYRGSEIVHLEELAAGDRWTSSSQVKERVKNLVSRKKPRALEAGGSRSGRTRCALASEQSVKQSP